MHRLLSVLAVAMLLSCSASKKATVETMYKPMAMLSHESEGILFVTFFMENTKKGTAVTDVQASFNKGRVKSEEAYDEGSLMLELIKGNKLKRVLYIENPLKPTFEIFSEDGQIEKTTAQLEKGTTTIRLNYQQDWDIVRIFEMNEDGKTMIARIRIL